MPALSSFSPVRWEPRVYRGSLDLAGRVRAHVRADLAAFPTDLVSDVELCMSELFANACEYTASGGQDGEVVRTLRLPDENRMRLEVTDGGFTDTRPQIHDFTGTDWFECERHRGLLMVSALALEWGFYPVLAHPTANLGLVVWADFTLTPGQAPADLPRYVHTT